MLNFIAYMKALQQDYLEFSIGTTQITLSRDHPTMWVLVRTIAAFQSVGIVFVWPIIEGSSSNPIWFPFQLCLPTTYLLSASYAQLMAAQIIFIVWLTMIPILNLLIMRQQQSQYNQHKLSQKAKINQVVDESESLKQVKLSLLYGHSDYMNFWFQNGYQQDTAYSLQYLVLKSICYSVNVFTEVFYLPLLYHFNILFASSGSLGEQLGLKITSATVLLITLVYTHLGLNYSQQSLSTSDANFLRLKKSFGLTVSRLCSGIAVLYVPFQYQVLQTHSSPEIPLIVITLVGLLGQLFDQFTSVPFVADYKRHLECYLISACVTACIVAALTDEFAMAEFAIMFLLGGRALVQHSDKQLNAMMSFVIERSQPQYENKQDLDNLVSGAFIRKVIQKMKDRQIYSFQHNDFSKFPHVLNMIRSFNLQRGEVLVRQEQNDSITYERQNPLKHKMLLLTYMLLQKHQDQCENIYCFCKGLRGENKSSYNQRESLENMCINADLHYFQISFYGEMVSRFLRNYAKTVFFVEKEKTYIPLVLIMQLINFVAASDECIQSVLLALELAGKLAHATQSISNFEALSINYLINWIRFSILHLFNQLVLPDQLELVFLYEDYRSSEKKRNKVFVQLMRNIAAKQDYLSKLSREQPHYDQIWGLYIMMCRTNQVTETMIQQFRSRNNSKTSLLCDMYFQLEIVNNYGRFLRLQAQLRSFEEKFFEFPTVFFQMEAFSNEVCYLKVDLNCSKSGDSFNGILSRGWIKDYSRNCPSYFNYSNTEFQQLKNVRELVPPSTSMIHDDFIEIVLLTARPFVLRAKVPLFIKTKEGFLVFTEFFADFNFKLQGGEFTIYIFLKKIKEKGRNGRLKNYLWVHREGIVEGITQNVLQSLELDDPNCDRLYRMHVSQLIPEFTAASEKLEALMQAHLDAEAALKGKDSATFSATFGSLQIVKQLTIENTLLKLPAEITESHTEVQYQLDCIIYLKHGQLIGRVYKVFLIEFIYFAKMDFEEVSQKQRVDTMEEEEQLVKMCQIPREHDLSDFKFEQLELFNFTDRNTQRQHVENPLIDNYSHENIINDFGTRPQYDTRTTKALQQQFYNNSADISKLSQSQVTSKKKEEEDRVRLQMDEKQINEIQSQGSTAGSSVYSRLITKSNYYMNFAASRRSPAVVSMLSNFNLFNVVTILAFMIGLATLQRKQDIQLLNSFVTTHYTSITLRAMTKRDPADKLTAHFEQGFTDLLETSIAQLKSSLAEPQIANIYRDSYVQLYDPTEEKEVNVSMWTAAARILYYEVTMRNNTDVSLDFFTKSYPHLREFYARIESDLQTRLTTQRDQLKDVVNIQIITLWLVIFLGLFLSFVLNNRIVLLLNKLLRCSEQISYAAIMQEQYNMQRLYDSFLYNSKRESAYIDLYGQTYDLKEKIMMLQVSDVRSSRNTAANKIHGSKKNISLKYKFDLRSRCQFLVPLTVLVVFAIVFTGLVSNPYSFEQDLEVFQLTLAVTESFSEMVMSLQMRSQDTLNSSFTNLNEDLAVILQNDYPQLQSLLQSDLCKTRLNSTLCPTLVQGILSSGLSVTFQHFISRVRESYSYPTVLYFEEVVLSTMVVDMLQEFILEMEADTLSKIEQQDDSEDYIIIGVVFLLAQLILAVLMNSWLSNKYQELKQFVFVVPPVSLYVEESFFKTLSYISQQEFQLME